MSDQSPAFESPAFPGDDEELDEDVDDEGVDEGELEDEDLEDEELDEDELDEEDGDDEVAGRSAPLAGGAGSDGDPNHAPGGRPRAVLEHIARSLVDEPEAVEVDVSEGRGGLTLSLRVAPGDMGRVIGKRGRIAQALRAVVRAAGARDGTEASVDIVD